VENNNNDNNSTINSGTNNQENNQNNENEKGVNFFKNCNSSRAGNISII
jgi:hypothetical protein